ncbi:unnamed protein product, partial [Owenia fusiformis]
MREKVSEPFLQRSIHPQMQRSDRELNCAIRPRIRQRNVATQDTDQRFGRIHYETIIAPKGQALNTERGYSDMGRDNDNTKHFGESGRHATSSIRKLSRTRSPRRHSRKSTPIEVQDENHKWIL